MWVNAQQMKSSTASRTAVGLASLALLALLAAQRASAAPIGNTVYDVILGLIPYANHGWTVLNIGPNPLTDGLTNNTYAYAGGNGSPNWVEYDLGTSYNLTRFAIVQGDGGTSRNRLSHVLLDVSSVSNFSTQTSYDLSLLNQDAYQTVSFGPITGRYVRITDNGTAGSPGPDRWVSDLGGVDGGVVNEMFVYEVPEPASLSLLALGGLALVRRRR